MKEIRITDNKTIQAIQEEFSDHFPFLKLEFYASAHTVGEGSANDDRIDPKLTIGAIRTKLNPGELSIHGNQKVSTLEEAFQEFFGLSVQVFRKSKELWLQTTSTDEWTLSEQNESGKAMSQD